MTTQPTKNTTATDASHPKSKFYILSINILTIAIFAIFTAYILKFFYDNGLAYPYKIHPLPYITSYCISLILIPLILMLANIYNDIYFIKNMLKKQNVEHNIMFRHSMQYFNLWDSAFMKFEKMLDKMEENEDNDNIKTDEDNTNAN